MSTTDPQPKDSLSALAQARAEGKLALDDLNWRYFQILFQKKNGSRPELPVVFHEAGRDTTGHRVAYPVLAAPPEMRQSVRLVQHETLKTGGEHYRAAAARAVLWDQKMQAGTGSSLTRETHKARIARELAQPEIAKGTGAKGVELFISVPADVPAKSSASPRLTHIPLAEAQRIQLMRARARGEFHRVIFHDIVSSETERSLRASWRKPSLLDPSVTYDELLTRTDGVARSGETIQQYVPTLDDQGRMSFNRMAPAGHGLFAINALRAAYLPALRPDTRGQPLVAAVSNGEDLSGTPDDLMVGYLVAERVPIALVTTDKTPVDLKVGIVSLIRDEAGEIALAMVETGQVAKAGQKAYAESLQGMMNTNLALFNYEALAPLLQREVAEIGEDAFLEIIAPDLIQNAKKQVDRDGVEREYIQLEGTMGSTILNLDRYWRRKHGQPLVHLINVDAVHRTEFFSPIKTAFDYWMQFHSDRFRLDPETMRLRNLRPGQLPHVSFKDPRSGDKFYQDVENVLEVFRGARILELDSLSIDGRVSLAGATLKGKVSIGIEEDTASGNPDAAVSLAGETLENVEIRVNREGARTVRKIHP